MDHVHFGLYVDVDVDVDVQGTLYANKTDSILETAIMIRIIVGTTQIMHVNSLRCYSVVISDI